MLHEFLSQNREELAERCRAKVAKRSAPRPTDVELNYGIPLFLGQLIDTLRTEETTPSEETQQRLPPDIGSNAGKHGNELLRKGFTIDQVVHDYGDLCQAVTELARERKVPITVAEFQTFNLCLDNAIADAVTEFGRQRDQFIADEGTQAMNERLGYLAHELRNRLNAAFLAFNAIKTGSVAVTGATGRVLDQSLIGLRDIVDRSLAEVRLTAGLRMLPATIALSDLLEEVQVSAAMEAKARGTEFAIAPIDAAIFIDVDRHMICSALLNLLQNAFKFTPPGHGVSLVTSATADRVLIEIEDECGGLPAGISEELFKPFEQRGGDRSGLGLGLSISRRAVQANLGKLTVRDVPGKGCVFAIDLPRHRAAVA